MSLGVTEAGLMLFPFPFSIFKKLFNKKLFWKTMYISWQRDPTSLDTYWRETLDHMVGGEDRVEPGISAGGFSGPEMVVFCTLLKTVGYAPANMLVIQALKSGWFREADGYSVDQARQDFEIG
jgi:hypothetical protein